MFDITWISRAHGNETLHAIIHETKEYTDRRKPFFGGNFIFYPRRGLLFIYSDIEEAFEEDTYVSHGDDGSYNRIRYKIATKYGREVKLKFDEYFEITRSIPGLIVSKKWY
jgi:hypothetical protein